MGSVDSPVSRRAVSEGLGTALLLSTIVGSGIMGSRLSGGDAAITLLVNSLATGLSLSVLLVILAPLSGAHLNPAVTLLEVLRRRIPPGELAPYVAGQILGAFVGVVVAHLMFGEQAFQASHHARNGAAQLLSEFVATFGLFTVLRGTGRRRPEVTAIVVGGYITAAYWFTASTAFANPAVTLARCVTDTFAGIRPRDVPGFVMAQLLGAAAATIVFSWLDPSHQVIGTSRPRALSPDLALSASLLVTLGCGQGCPVAPGAEREDWLLDDPRGQPLPAVRRIREEISKRVRGLIGARGWARRV